MPTFRENVRRARNFVRRNAIEVIGGRPYQEHQKNVAWALDQAFRRGPALVPTETLLSRLGEVDQRLIDLLMDSHNWRVLSGVAFGKLRFTEQDRQRAVEESRYYYHFDVQFQNAVQMWTDFGFGQRINVVPTDEKLREVWDEFRGAPRNKPILKQRKLHTLSNDQVVDGEQFFVFSTSTIDSETRIRRARTDEITEVVYDNDDPDVPLFYVRSVEKMDDNTTLLYYPDWSAWRDMRDRLDTVEIPDGAKRADEMDEMAVIDGEETPATVRVMQHIAGDEIDGRGWPRFYRVPDWTSALKQLIGDQMTVRKAVATFVDKLIVQGGSRASDAVAAKFASTISTTNWTERNPSAAPGSTLVHNDAVTSERRPLATGAGDAQADSFLPIGQISAGTKVPPHWMGFPGAMQNRATARESSKPFEQQMERYQIFWTDVFQEWVEIVAMFAVEFNAQIDDGTFSTTDAVVTMETPLDLEVNDIVGLFNAVEKAAADAIIDAGQAGRVLAALAVLALNEFGIQGAGGVVEGEIEQQGESGAAERIAAVIKANLADGTADAQSVAEWALAELLEGA